MYLNFPVIMYLKFLRKLVALIVLNVSVVVGYEYKSESFLSSKQNQRLNTSELMRSWISTNRILCVQSCLTLIGCAAVNYNKVSSKCECLSEQSLVNEMTEDSQWDHVIVRSVTSTNGKLYYISGFHLDKIR